MCDLNDLEDLDIEELQELYCWSIQGVLSVCKHITVGVKTPGSLHAMIGDSPSACAAVNSKPDLKSLMPKHFTLANVQIR